MGRGRPHEASGPAQHQRGDQSLAQSVPFTCSTVGAVSWPVSVPLKPIVVDPPFAARSAFQLAAFTVTFSPLCDQVPSQPSATASPAAGKVNVSVHGLIAVLPLLVIVTEAPNPP